MLYITSRIEQVHRFSSYRVCIGSDLLENMLFLVISWLIGSYLLADRNQYMKVSRIHLYLKTTLNAIQVQNDLVN
jgi:hypothetical protein